MKTLISTLMVLVVISSQAQKRNVNVGSFNELSLGIPATLYVKQGSSNKVEIECGDDIFDEIEFDMRGDRLVIKKENDNWNWKNGWRNSEVDIYVTMEEIEALVVSGNGNIESSGKLRVDDLELVISGAGDIDVDIEGDEVETRISGSGSIKVAGNANEANSRISGSGKINGEDLTVKTYEARISGSGSCYITVEEEIEASISGSGSVYYNGNPNRVISNSSGSGKIRKM